jgi:glycogen synthase
VPERPLRVAVIGRSVYALHGVGGLERHLYDLLKYHLAEGWHVTLITREPARRNGVDPARWHELAGRPQLAVRTVPYRTFPLAGRKGTTILDRSTAYPWFGRRAGRLAARLVRAGEVDIVYGVGASVYGYALAKTKSGGSLAPLVMNPQGLEEFGGADGSYGGVRLKRAGYAPLRRVVKRTAHLSDAVIATDAALVPIVTSQLAVDPARVRLIPNGLDVSDERDLVSRDAGRALRAKHRIEPDAVVLVSVGRIEANKGFGDMAQALARIRRPPHWRWVIVGDGPGRTPLEATVGESGLRRDVIWAGRTDDRTLHAWYDAADLFVHPTRYEGSSLVTLEAMLHGKPVLATRAGGLPDKVLPGRTGWLADPGNPAALGAALEDALAQRDRWPEFGRAGRALLGERFDWRIVQAAYARLYHELLGL